jgi:surface polysaccharide O-acyltransferase-like enzyme
MNKFLSNKIKVLSFFLILMVLYIHAGFNNSEIGKFSYLNFVQELISNKIFRLAVPLFFMLSGYLFFVNIIGNHKLKILNKLKSRIKTLFIPYIIGCLFYVLIYLIIESIPVFSNQINSSIFYMYNQDFLLTLKDVFFTSQTGKPIAYHLWFLRDLIMLVIISPLLFYGIYYGKYFFPLFILGAGVILSNNEEIMSYISSCFWFSLGGVLASSKNLMQRKININYGLVLFALYILIGLVELFFNLKLHSIIIKLIVLVGVLGFWFSYDFFNKHFSFFKGKYLLSFCSFNFFIYVFHQPLMNIFRKLFLTLGDKSAFYYCLAYFLSPILVLLVLLLIGNFLKNNTTKIYSLISGGRV